MLYDNIDYSSLIKFDKNGLVVANYTEIRSVITERYKQIYGYDIDLSTGTADGQFIEMLCLMMNNILLTVKQMYAGLNANYAQGKMLDVICAFTNVQRRSATYSTASITVTNTSETDITLSSLDVFDKSGLLWNWTSNTPLTFSSTPQSITVTCSEIGPIKAEAGWITKTALNLPLSINQPNNAIVGQAEETDSHLKARRNNSLAMMGLTTLESLKAALLNIAGIEDVFTYNNASNTDVEVVDGTTVEAHQVYICIRKNSNIAISDETLGKLIYEKMTPGIQSCKMETGLTTGISKEYDYESSVGIMQKVYWKECVAVHPAVVINITKYDNFDINTVDIIKQRIIDYCNNLNIGTNLSAQELFVQAIYADPKFRGLPTYAVNSSTVNATNSFTNEFTFYNFTTSDITVNVS